MSDTETFVAQRPASELPSFDAFVLPPHRICEAREIAAGAKWFNGCPEARCRERENCMGKLRRIGHGARCYPGCLALALGTLLDPASTADARAAFRRLLAPNGFFEVGEEDMPTPPEALLTLLLSIAVAGQPDASP